MRLTNKRKLPVYNFILSGLIIILIGGLSLFVVEKYKMDFLGWESIFLIVGPCILFILFWMRGDQVFEYDSDGEALNFTNFNIVPFLSSRKKDEFPKYKLLKYEVVNMIFVKRLYITISSKKVTSLVLKYDISYLSDKEIRDLKFSLNKVLKTNKNQNSPVID